MTPRHPTLAATVRTRVKPSAVWQVYERMDWSTFNRNISSVKATKVLSLGLTFEISTTKPSFSGSTFIESCFKDQNSNGIIVYSLNFNPLASMTSTFKLETVKGGETEITHGVRYDGMLKRLYEGSVEEGELRESVEEIIRQAEELEKASNNVKRPMDGGDQTK